jgi:hypothetical protein
MCHSSRSCVTEFVHRDHAIISGECRVSLSRVPLSIALASCFFALQRGPLVRAFAVGGIVHRRLIGRMDEALTSAAAVRQGEATMKPDAALVGRSKRLGRAKRPGFVKGKR